MKSLRSSIVLFFLFFFSCSVNASASGGFDAKIAIVDIQYILENSLAIQSIRKDIERIGKDIEKDMLKKEAELKKQEEILIKKRDSLTEENFNIEVNSFNAKVSQAQQEIQNKKVRLEQAHSKAVSKVYETTIEIITDLSRKKNFNLVMPTTQILYAKDNFNITSEVISQLNAKLKLVTVNYK
jgi:Skp family chaperone for outer membrane proteins